MVTDITVFDYENIRDNSSYNDSVVNPGGIEHVFIAGVPEILNGEQTYNLKGKFILKNQ